MVTGCIFDDHFCMGLFSSFLSWFLQLSHSALERHGRGSEIDSFDVSIMNSFALDINLSLLVTSSSGGVSSEYSIVPTTALRLQLLRRHQDTVLVKGSTGMSLKSRTVDGTELSSGWLIFFYQSCFSALSSLTKINILSPSNIPGSLRPTLSGRQGI